MHMHYVLSANCIKKNPRLNSAKLKIRNQCAFKMTWCMNWSITSTHHWSAPAIINNNNIAARYLSYTALASIFGLSRVLLNWGLRLSIEDWVLRTCTYYQCLSLSCELSSPLKRMACAGAIDGSAAGGRVCRRPSLATIALRFHHLRQSEIPTTTLSKQIGDCWTTSYSIILYINRQ